MFCRELTLIMKKEKYYEISKTKACRSLLCGVQQSLGSNNKVTGNPSQTTV